MKKVLSVALASAMVLGMGANAFAISYSTGSNDKADWPDNFKFDGELFVTNKDGDIVEEASTELNDNENVNFEPGDVIWMPLYADDQLSYDAEYEEGTDDVEAINSIKLEDGINKVKVSDTWAVYIGEDKNLYDGGGKQVELPEGYVLEKTNQTINADGKVKPLYTAVKFEAEEIPATIKFDGVERDVVSGSARYYVGTKAYKTAEAFAAAALKNPTAEMYVTVNLEKISGKDESVGKPVVDEENGARAYGHYTGNIDKNWSINLIEASTGVAELIEKAELYRATATDYASYNKYTDEIEPNAVYLKVTLKKEWKTTDSETMKYYVYVAKNNGSTATRPTKFGFPALTKTPITSM